MKWAWMPTDKDLKETDVSGTCRDKRTTKIRRTHPRLDRTGMETEELTPRFPERFGHLQHPFRRRRPKKKIKNEKEKAGSGGHEWLPFGLKTG